MKKILFSILTFSFLALPVLADDVTTPSPNVVSTAMPSLTIAPDGRSAGMGDAGVATSADINSQHWNPAKYAFMESKGGLSVSYTPWLRQLVGDIDLAYIVGYYNMGEKAGTLSGSFKYFSMGEVSMVGFDESFLGTATPNEWALDLGYSRKLHEYVSMAVAMRFMYSDLNNGFNSSMDGGSDMYPGWTMAADIALYYRQPISLPMGESYFGLGFNLSNLGGKISHDDGTTKNFIPANMRLGVSYELPFDNYNRLTATVECNKMLVPTYKSKFAKNQETGRMEQDEFSQLTSVNGWWQSFCDAPNGAAEEFQEVQWSAGLEYSYNRQFFGRIGYSHEGFTKGNRRYLTLGAGFHLSIFSLDFAYCIATAASNPLNNTMRFTLGFDLAGIKDMVNNRK